MHHTEQAAFTSFALSHAGFHDQGAHMTNLPIILKWMSISVLWFICVVTSKAMEPAEWMASITAESANLRAEFAALWAARKQQPENLVTDVLQKSKACYVDFMQFYKDPKFDRLDESEDVMRQKITEQVRLATVMVIHETICLEIIYKSLKNQVEAKLVSSYEGELKQRMKMMENVEFDVSEYSQELAFLLFTYRSLLRGVEQEPEHLNRFRRLP